MEAVYKPRSIKLIYWFTTITFWMYVVTTILAMFLVAAILFFELETLQLNVGIPVKINVVEQGTLDLNITDKFIDVNLVDLTGNLQFVRTPIDVGRVYAVFIFAIALLILYIFVIVKRFVSNVYNGIYFDIKNISLLKRISYAIAVVWIFVVFFGFFQYYFLVINLNFETVEFTSDIQTYPLLILFALFIWVLSHIFVKGCELKVENELTV
jgi:DUF2975 family protein